MCSREFVGRETVGNPQDCVDPLRAEAEQDSMLNELTREAGRG